VHVSQQIHTVGLSWQHSGILAATLLVAGVTLNFVTIGWLRWLAPALRECAMIAGLYGLWVLAGSLSVAGAGDGYARARWILHAEHDLRLPSERDLEHLINGHRLIAQVCDLFYATMHFSTMFAFLLWLFVRHRDQYRPIRRVLALTTLLCLIVQLMPVAPPRLMPGFTDIAAKYGQSVYAGGLAADQLSAMPSVHVAWAVLVGWGVVHVSTSRWRWLAVLHPAVTIFVVVATANHYWADGIVAVALLVCCIYGERGVSGWVATLRSRHAVAPAELNPAPMARILP
jgi:hypothetical protein